MIALIRKLCAHCAIIISGMYIVFYCIDRVNPAMSFIDNDITKMLLVILAALSVLNGIFVIAEERRKLRRRMRRSTRRGE
jgi:hypothetical protein